jgi:hypothetical protein
MMFLTLGSRGGAEVLCHLVYDSFRERPIVLASEKCGAAAHSGVRFNVSPLTLSHFSPSGGKESWTQEKCADGQTLLSFLRD